MDYQKSYKKQKIVKTPAPETVFRQ
jgi:hypothetical protein